MNITEVSRPKSVSVFEKLLFVLACYPLFTFVVFLILGARAYSAFGRIPTISDNTQFLSGNLLLSFFLLGWFYIPVVVSFMVLSIVGYRKAIMAQRTFMMLQGLFWGFVVALITLFALTPSGWVVWWLD
jgi:hypothetical protein